MIFSPGSVEGMFFIKTALGFSIGEETSMEFGTLPLAVETKRKLAGFFETGQLPHALLLEGGTAAVG